MARGSNLSIVLTICHLQVHLAGHMFLSEPHLVLPNGYYRYILRQYTSPVNLIEVHLASHMYHIEPHAAHIVCYEVRYTSPVYLTSPAVYRETFLLPHLTSSFSSSTSYPFKLPQGAFLDSLSHQHFHHHSSTLHCKLPRLLRSRLDIYSRRSNSSITVSTTPFCSAKQSSSRRQGGRAATASCFHITCFTLHSLGGVTWYESHCCLNNSYISFFPGHEIPQRLRLG